MERNGIPVMYMRVEQMHKTFTVQKLITGKNSRGRAVTSWRQGSPALQFQGFKADATQQDIERYKQNQHPITHTIRAQGAPMAVAGDRLKDQSGKYLYIQGVENPGDLDLWTFYHCEERLDERRDGK